jgi:hypothetical protein
MILVVQQQRCPETTPATVPKRYLKVLYLRQLHINDKAVPTPSPNKNDEKI